MSVGSRLVLSAWFVSACSAPLQAPLVRADPELVAASAPPAESVEKTWVVDPPPFRGFPLPAFYAGCSTTLPALLSPEAEHYFAQKPEVFEWQKLALFHDQAPPTGFRGIPEQVKGPFPGRKFSRVVFLQQFAKDRIIFSDPVLDDSVPGCGMSLVSADGRFCPSVSYPPIELSPEQAAELVAIVNQRPEREWYSTSGWRMDEGFVFLDDIGAPVAEVQFGKYSFRLHSLPRMPWDDANVGNMRGWRLQRLIEHLSPEPSPSEAVSRAIDEQFDRDDEWIGECPGRRELRVARSLPARSSLDERLIEAQLSVEQRKIACAWQQLVWAFGTPRSGAGGGSYECVTDHARFTNLDFLACQSAFPRCNAPVGEIEACMRRQRFDPCFSEPGWEHCRALRGCFWGMFWQPPESAQPR